MTGEPRRLHRLSWLFLTASTAKGLLLPLILVVFASSTNPWARFELLGALFMIPTLIGALIKQRIYKLARGQHLPGQHKIRTNGEGLSHKVKGGLAMARILMLGR